MILLVSGDTEQRLKQENPVTDVELQLLPSSESENSISNSSGI